MIDICREQVLDDVVRVDLVLAASCHFAAPFQVAMTEMGVTNLSSWTPQSTSHAVIGQALLSVAYMVQDGDDGEIDTAPVLKQTDKQTAAGIVVTHDLQVPLSAGFEATREAVKGLQTRYFHAILTTMDGTVYLIYALPNTSVLLLDEQEVAQKATLKITLQSMSHVIRLK